MNFQFFKKLFKGSATTPYTPERRLYAIALEPRILYDGAGVGAALVGALDVAAAVEAPPAEAPTSESVSETTSEAASNIDVLLDTEVGSDRELTPDTDSAGTETIAAEANDALDADVEEAVTTEINDAIATDSDNMEATVANNVASTQGDGPDQAKTETEDDQIPADDNSADSGLSDSANDMLAADSENTETTVANNVTSSDDNEREQTESANDMLADDSDPPEVSSTGDDHSIESDILPLDAAVETAPADIVAVTTDTDNQRTELVFIDGNVTDADALIEAAADKSEVIILNADQSGIQQITDNLAGRNDIDALHIISHGGSGYFSLGAEIVQTNTLDNYADALASWGDALTDDADLLLYGCFVGNTADGEELLDGLATLTGVDVAASTDVTGSAALRGDWELEIATGTIEAAVIQADNYDSKLTDYIVSNTDDLGAGSLRQAIIDFNTAGADGVADNIIFNIASGSTITLSPGQLSITGTDQLTIDGDLNDDGIPDITIDANNTSRVFYISALSDVTLDGLIITGGSSWGGSGIFNDGTVTITNSTISGNTATLGGDGGGINNRFGSTATIIDSIISGNTAEEDGGGIASWAGATLTITNSTISDNTAGRVGGGIANWGDATIMTITNSSISDNTADQVGGGIFNSATVTITDSTISGNLAGDNGGGINNSGDVIISNSIISENTADDGGGIYNWDDAAITITNCAISENTANNDGGGISNTWNGTTTIADSTISGNTANNDGGGISNTWNGTATIADSTISGNMASIGGGISNTENGTATIVDSTISGNTADNKGGGIYNNNAATIISSNISGNTANIGAGIRNYGEATINYTTISGNQSSLQSAGISNWGVVTINNSQISDNTAVGTHGGLWNAGIATITDSTLSNNIAGTSGGGISNIGELTITNSTISGNTAGIGGGGISNNSGGTATITNSTIAFNTDNTGANGIFNDNTVNIGHTIVADGVSGPAKITSQGYNLFSQAAVNGSIGTDLLSADADLQPLADNGGPTQTHALGSHSDALNTGDLGFSPPPDTDQRGESRIFGTAIDIGAYEAQSNPPTATNLNTAETYTQDTPVDLTDIVVTDPDAGDTITVTLALSDAAAGSLSTGTSGSVASTFVDGVWTASGPLNNVNALLAGVIFTPASGYHGNFNINTSVSDGVFSDLAGTKPMTGVAAPEPEPEPETKTELEQEPKPEPMSEPLILNATVPPVPQHPFVRATPSPEPEIILAPTLTAIPEVIILTPSVRTYTTGFEYSDPGDTELITSGYDEPGGYSVLPQSSEPNLEPWSFTAALSGLGDAWDLSADAGLPNRTADALRPFMFAMPEQAFSLAYDFQELTFTAELENGSPLPDWVSIDPNTGAINGNYQGTEPQTLMIRVIARDPDGMEAVATFRLKIEQDLPDVAETDAARQHNYISFAQQVEWAGSQFERESEQLLQALTL